MAIIPIASVPIAAVATDEPLSTLVKDINPTGGSNVRNFVSMGNNVYFSAEYGPTGKDVSKSFLVNKASAMGSSSVGLFKSDGTEAGTTMILQGSVRCLTRVGNAIYFGYNDGVRGDELWKTDGTVEGTVMVKDINATGSGFPLALADINNTLYFSANDGINGTELWKSDGTETGTEMMKDIDPGFFDSSTPYGGDPSRFTLVNDTVFFRAATSETGIELWKTDGTAAGTVMVKDIYSGPNGSGPENLYSLNNELYFSAYASEEAGTELWKSDGTVDGTVMIKDIYLGGSSTPSEFRGYDGKLYFSAFNSDGSELWKSDGTESGTVMVKDIFPGVVEGVGENSSFPSELTVFNGQLYFSARDNDSNFELWKTDGSEAGTVQVTDVNPQADSYPNYLTVFDGKLYFNAYDEVNGLELRRSDGTGEGTTIVKDIRPGVVGSNPKYLLAANNKLFMVADDGEHGAEPWAIVVPDTQFPVYNNLPGEGNSINVTEGQTITTNPYIIKVRPTDENDISKVEFYIDDTLVCTDTTADPDGVYSCSWDTSRYHSIIKILAYDTSDNATEIKRETTVDPTLYTAAAIPKLTQLPATGGK